MTDYKMTELCALAMGLRESRSEITEGYWGTGTEWIRYTPLTDDAQAMALVKHLGLNITRAGRPAVHWIVSEDFGAYKQQTSGPDLNRAIVECVAKMQANTGAGER